MLKNFCSSWKTWGAAVLLGVLSLPTSAWPQDESQSSNPQKPADQNSQQTPPPQNQDTTPVSPMGIEWGNTYFHEIGSAGLLAGNPQGLHWGRLYIPQASINGVEQHFQAQGTGGGVSGSSSFALFQTLVVYDRQFSKNRLALQYQPDVAIQNGQVATNFNNQTASVDWILYSRPRLSIRFSDSFSYYSSQHNVTAQYFVVNTTSPITLTGNFLEGPSRWISDGVNLNIAYAPSARTMITILPRYTFSENGEGVNLNRGIAYGGTISWTRLLSARQSVGLEYSSELIHQGRTVVQDTIYQTFAGTFQRQLSPTWHAGFAAGATTSTTSGTSASRQWNFYGTASVSKTFRRFIAALSYDRSNSFAYGYISSTYADRVDATVQAPLGRRLSLGAGAGYIRQVVPAFGFQAKYGTGHAGYLLAPRAGLSATFDYARKFQGSNGVGLFAGTFDLFSYGILWQPRRPDGQ